MNDLNFYSFPVHKVVNGACSCGNISCGAIGKHPKVKAFKENSSNNFKPDFSKENLGIVTGSKNGIVVIDVDPRNGGLESFQKLKQENKIPDTLRVETPSGGFHLYYELPDGLKIKTSHGKLGKGIDVQAEGAYVLGVGSNHLQGIYKWEEDFSPESGMVLERLPDCLVEQLEEFKEHNIQEQREFISSDKMLEIEIALEKIDVKKSSYSDWVAVGQALHGIDNHGDKPFSLWSRWSKKDDPKRVMKDIALIRKWNTFKAGAVNSSWIFGLAKSQGISPESITLEAMSRIAQSQKKSSFVDYEKNSEKIKYDVELPNGRCGMLISEYMKELPQIPSQIAIGIFTQAFPAMLFQGLAATHAKTSISTFFIMAGRQGCGKSTALNSLHAMAEYVDPDLASIPLPASGVALKQVLAGSNGVAVSLNDELLAFIRAVKAKANKGDTMADILLTLWSMSQNGSLSGQIAADDKYKAAKVKAPAFSLIGGGIAREWAELANDNSFMTSGFGSRLEAISWGDKIFIEEDVFFLRFGEKLTALLDGVKMAFDNISSKYDRENRFIVPMTGAAKKALKEYDRQCTEHDNAGKNGDEAITKTRLPELACRIATRIALINCRAYPTGLIDGLEVDEETMTWAIKYVDNQFDANVSTANSLETEELAFKRRLFKQLRNHGPQTKSQISNNSGKRTKTYIRNQIISELIESGEIKKDGILLKL